MLPYIAAPWILWDNICVYIYILYMLYLHDGKKNQQPLAATGFRRNRCSTACAGFRPRRGRRPRAAPRRPGASSRRRWWKDGRKNWENWRHWFKCSFFLDGRTRRGFLHRFNSRFPRFLPARRQEEDKRLVSTAALGAPKECSRSGKKMGCSSIWVCLKIVYPYTQWLMIIIPTKWL